MTPTHFVRILVADDHEIVRAGLRALLQKHAGWEVCGEAGDGKQAVEKARELRPDVIIMDVTMPELNGLESARRILTEFPGVNILILSMHECDEIMEEALKIGVHGYLLKLDAARELISAVEAVSKGGAFVSSRLARADGSRYTAASAAAAASSSPRILTGREREVLQLLAEGKTSKEVASVLSISTKTAETHRTNIMQKLDLHSITDLTRYAIRNHIVEP